MKYIIMCGGEYPYYETPRWLTEVCGEPIVKRTIRLEPDKTLIREYLKDHPDCEFARIGERGKHIEVK